MHCVRRESLYKEFLSEKRDLFSQNNPRACIQLIVVQLTSRMHIQTPSMHVVTNAQVDSDPLTISYRYLRESLLNGLIDIRLGVSSTKPFKFRIAEAAAL